MQSLNSHEYGIEFVCRKENKEMNKVKSLFPDNVEKIIISKGDYDRLTGELTLENIKSKQEIERLNTTIQSNINSYNKLAKYSSDLEDRIDKAIEYIEKHSNSFSVLDIISNSELLKILKGSDKEWIPKECFIQM